MDTTRAPANRDSVAAGERVVVLDLNLAPKAVPDRLGITLRAFRAFGKLGSDAGPVDHELGLQDLIRHPEVPVPEEIAVKTMRKLLISLGHSPTPPYWPLLGSATHGDLTQERGLRRRAPDGPEDSRRRSTHGTRCVAK